MNINNFPYFCQIGKLFNVTMARYAQQSYIDQLAVEPYIAKNTDKIYASKVAIESFRQNALRNGLCFDKKICIYIF
jgi:hypothetical protein